MAKPKNIEDRLREIEFLDNGCWEWQGYVVAKSGYGLICYRRNGAKSSLLIHRYFYMELVGPVPEGMVLDHTCHNTDPDCPGGPTCRHRRCVNPAHLEPVTPKVNVLRGKGLSAENAVKDACAHGHEFSAGNTYIDKYGRRGCITCRTAATQRYRCGEGGEKVRAAERERMRLVRQEPGYREKKNAWAREAYRRKKAEKEAQAA